MLKTEQRNARTTHIDKMSISEMLKIMNDENNVVIKAIDDALPQIEKGCIAMSEAIKSGGRVFYMGAGTSGRLGIADAAECPPTFGVPYEMFNGIIAGGRECVFAPAESNEDNPKLAIKELKERNFSSKDILVGISAAGGAAFVISALEYAKEQGAKTIAITNNPDTKISKIADITIFADTGAEVITGSTRMKAGTSQKIILNMLSTVSMIRCGYVYENMMINLKPSNIKLKNRMIGIVCEITKKSPNEAETLLNNADWNIPRAIEREKNYEKI